MRATVLPYAILLTKACDQYNGQGVYYGLSAASEVFLIITTQQYQYFSVFFLFALFSDDPEVFLPEYSQTAILHAAHFRWVVTYQKERQDIRVVLVVDARPVDSALLHFPLLSGEEVLVKVVLEPLVGHVYQHLIEAVHLQVLKA